jgi:hypothetical protein
MNRATSLCTVLASVALASTPIAAEVAAQAITVVPASPTVTGWTRPSTTVTVSFTMGWSLGVDDITYTTEP